MTAEDRAARQRAADIEGRAERIDALFDATAKAMTEYGRRVRIDAARADVDRAAIARILGPTPHPDPLPALPPVAYPRKLASFVDFDPYLDAGTIDELVRDVQEKLAAEAARLRRLLPPPLPGHEWRGEISHDVDYHFDVFAAHDTIRLRYRMVKIEAES